MDDPAAAKKTIKRIERAANKLKDFPLLGRIGMKGTRELAVKSTSYLLPYRIRNDVIEILHVFHTRRRHPVTWKEPS